MAEAEAETAGELAELDSDSFNPAEFVNRLFPSETALVGMEPLIQKLKLKIRRVDADILDSVRSQSTSGSQAKADLHAAQQAIQELNGHIQEIKSKADQSEAMVQEICRDIKKLDFAKKNLTSTITALRRLGMLVSAVDQLEDVAGRKRYRDAANLLEAVNQLSAHFEAYKDIPRIAEVRSKCASIKAALRSAVLDDFSRFGREGDEALYSGGELADACLVVDALEPHVREELVATLCSRELGAYTSIFSATSGEASHLDKVERRFAYIKRKIGEREAAWAIFPPPWRVGALCVAALCKVTRAQLAELLDAQGGDVQAVLQALHRTLEFERSLDERFGGARRGGDGGGSDEEGEEEEDFAAADESSAASLRRKYEKARRAREHEAAVGDKPGAQAMESAAREAGRMSFRGSVSSAFEPHLRGYVDLEEKQLTECVDALLAGETWQADAATMAMPDAPKVLASASQVFLNIKKVLKRGSGLTRGGTLFSLAQVFARVLAAFAARLLARLPKDGAFPDGEERVCCFIINTAQYCRDTCAPLGESLARLLEPPWGDRVDFGALEEDFSGVVAAALQALGAGAEARLEPVLAAMTRGRWGELEAPGDQSEYVTQLAAALHAYVPPVTRLLSPVDGQYFCEKLAASFAPRFYAAIFRCRRFNEAGAQQLLLDSHAVKSLLLDVPQMGATQPVPEGFAAAPAPAAVPASYVKLVGREMNRAEALLKVIQAPPEVVGDMFRTLLPDAGMGELRQVLELKGLRRAEAQQLLEEQAAKGLAAGGAAAGAAPSRSAGLMPSLRLGGGLAGLSELGSGLREGLGELRSGLGAGLGSSSGAGGPKAPAAAQAETSRLQPAEAFRSAGRYLAQTGRTIKAAAASVSDTLGSGDGAVPAAAPQGQAGSGGGVGARFSKVFS